MTSAGDGCRSSFGAGGDKMGCKKRTNEEMYRDNDSVFRYMKDFSTQDKVLPAMRKNVHRYKNSMIVNGR